MASGTQTQTHSHTSEASVSIPPPVQYMDVMDAVGGRHQVRIFDESGITARLVEFTGSDQFIANVARVSTTSLMHSSLAEEATRNAGLLNMLVRDRHGSPFEHASMTWVVRAPIFVIRELVRHRIASYNEMSGRYRELPLDFYVPDLHRPLTQVGKPGAYSFTDERNEELHSELFVRLVESYAFAAMSYVRSLSLGVAREVARIVLPVSLFSEIVVTMNVRALTNFLSLRNSTQDSKVPTFPMHEIQLLARLMEADLQLKFPITHAKFIEHGRVPL